MRKCRTQVGLSSARGNAYGSKTYIYNSGLYVNDVIAGLDPAKRAHYCAAATLPLGRYVWSIIEPPSTIDVTAPR